MAQKPGRKVCATSLFFHLTLVGVATFLACTELPSVDAFSSTRPLTPQSGISQLGNQNPYFSFSSSSSILLAASDENTSGDEKNEEEEDSKSNNDDTNRKEIPEDNSAKSKAEAEAERLKQQARELREQISKMEADLPEKPVDPERAAALKAAQEAAAAAAASDAAGRRPGEPVSLLDGKNILLVGSNGRLGSMVCRRLLREYPEIANVVAMVHVIGENSETSRGYGRLAYEVGAEDGRGSIGSAWSADDRTATFEFDEEVMTPYNLQKLRIVECEVRT